MFEKLLEIYHQEEKYEIKSRKMSKARVEKAFYL
jgi:hypothetical protein